MAYKTAVTYTFNGKPVKWW